MLGDVGQLETVERLMRRGVYTGPLVLNWVGIGGGADGPNPYNMMEFINRCPSGAVLTIESIMRNVPLLNTMAIAMGLHVRVGIEDNLWAARRAHRPACSRSSRWCASRANCTARWPAARSPAIYRIGEHYASADETLVKLGYAPNRQPGERGGTACVGGLTFRPLDHIETRS